MITNDAQNQIDTRALEVAIEAKIRGEAHENACFLKHEQVLKSISELRSDFKNALIWLIALLLSLCAFLLVTLLQVKQIIP